MNNKEYFEKLSKKKIAIAVIFLSKNEEILILKSSYKHNTWLLPGGAVEQDESPLSAAYREIDEEINVNVKITKLLMTEYNNSGDDYNESIFFIYLGSMNCPIDSIKIDNKEIIDAKYVSHTELSNYCNKKMSQRILLAFEANKKNRSFYVENQKK